MRERTIGRRRRGVAWLGLAWLGLAWLGLAWLGLAWLGLAWLGLAWLLPVVGTLAGDSARRGSNPRPLPWQGSPNSSTRSQFGLRQSSARDGYLGPTSIASALGSTAMGWESKQIEAVRGRS